MKQHRYFFMTLALACVIPLFLGCPKGDDEPNYGGELKELPAVSLASADGVKYYSLSSGEEVTGADIASTKWDIAFSRERLIFTNSGDTAKKLSSGGKGGVWYTDKAELAEVSLGDKKGEDDPILGAYITDQNRYVKSMGDPKEIQINVMTYVGYNTAADKDGLSAENCLQGFLYDQKQYYKSLGMGKFSSTGITYIICHGDGAGHSKIKIVYEYIDSKDTWAVSYQNF